MRESIHFQWLSTFLKSYVTDLQKCEKWILLYKVSINECVYIFMHRQGDWINLSNRINLKRHFVLISCINILHIWISCELLTHLSQAALMVVCINMWSQNIPLLRSPFLDVLGESWCISLTSIFWRIKIFSFAE